MQSSVCHGFLHATFTKKKLIIQIQSICSMWVAWCLVYHFGFTWFRILVSRNTGVWRDSIWKKIIQFLQELGRSHVRSRIYFCIYTCIHEIKPFRSLCLLVTKWSICVLLFVNSRGVHAHDSICITQFRENSST